jgi:hypothetical protein
MKNPIPSKAEPTTPKTLARNREISKNEDTAVGGVEGQDPALDTGLGFAIATTQSPKDYFLGIFFSEAHLAAAVRNG